MHTISSANNCKVHIMVVHPSGCNLKSFSFIKYPVLSLCPCSWKHMREGLTPGLRYHVSIDLHSLSSLSETPLMLCSRKWWRSCRGGGSGPS